MTLEEALEKAAAELPEDAMIAVEVGRRGAFVLAWNWYGDPGDIDLPADKTLAEQVLAGLQWCKDTSPKEEQEE